MNVIKACLMASFIAVSFGLVGCSQGSKFEGKWVTSTRSDWDGTRHVVRLDIGKNGENFIIIPSTEMYKDTGKTIGEMGKKAAWSTDNGAHASANLQEGKLMLNPLTGFTFVKSDGTLLGPSGEVYKKETTDELNRLKKEATESFKQYKPQMSLQQ